MTSAFSKSSVVIDRFHRIRVDGSRIRKEKIAFSNQNGYLWTGPYMRYYRVLRSTFLSCSPDFLTNRRNYYKCVSNFPLT